MALDPQLEQKLKALEGRSDELSGVLAAPDVMSDMQRYKSVSRSYADLQPVLIAFREYAKAEKDLAGARELLATADDAEMKALATQEVTELSARLVELEGQLRLRLLPRDPNDEKNVVLEVRAGTGGGEATLFAAEIFRMYARYAERQKWKVKTSGISESAVGGAKEIIAIIEGENVYSRLKFESGVHRVQRVPATETQGRVHTSAVTVAVLPEADEVEVEIDPKELRIDTFCSSGPGGQSVNTTQSAVRINHLPTGLVVQCQDEKSWHKNKAQAMKVMRSRLYDKMRKDQHDAIAKERKGMVGSGDRSEKIRTYNFPQSRVTDHRIGLTVHNLAGLMDGDLGTILDALIAEDQADRLREEVDA